MIASSKKYKLHFILILFVKSIWLVQILHASSSASSSSSRGPQSASPISNWGPSWAASSAQGTTTAISFSLQKEKDEQPVPAVLILMRSLDDDNEDGEVDTSEMTLSCTRTFMTLNGVKVLLIDPSRITFSDSSKRWNLLGPSALCCMTGLFSDVDYLTRRLQQSVENDCFVYDADHAFPILGKVRVLSEMLRSATKWKGDRPFGVQALLIGPQRRGTLSLFTLDPSGGYRHWGAATAIGKAASLVRKRLHENIIQTPVLSMELVLRVSLNATMSALGETSSHNSLMDTSSYQGLVVWNDCGRLRSALIDPAELRKMRQSLCKEASGSKALS
jgi:20S proteasome alpha/beta subunit